MKILELIQSIQKDESCHLNPPKMIVLPETTPSDLRLFFEHTDGGILFEGTSYSIEIVGREAFISTNMYLFQEEPEGEVSNQWYLIAKSDLLSQYISIDLTKERNWQCYDSFYEIHAMRGNSAIIGRNFTELLESLYKAKWMYWYWLVEDFVKLGDAYDTPIISLIEN